jgi:hypothetical protein
MVNIAIRHTCTIAIEALFCDRLFRRMIAMLRGIDIVTIPVTDQGRALKFYTEKLGFKVATNQDFGDGKQRWIELLIPIPLYVKPQRRNLC